MNTNQRIAASLATCLLVAAAVVLAFEEPAPDAPQEKSDVALEPSSARPAQGARQVAPTQDDKAAPPAPPDDAPPREDEPEPLAEDEAAEELPVLADAPRPGGSESVQRASPAPEEERASPPEHATGADAQPAPTQDAASDPSATPSRAEPQPVPLEAPAPPAPPAAPAQPAAPAPPSVPERPAPPAQHAPPARPNASRQVDAPERPAAPREPSAPAEGIALSRNASARVHVPGAATPAQDERNASTPDATVPAPCALDACRNETALTPGEVATPAIESVPLATQDTHVDGASAGPLSVDAYDAPTGMDLGETPGHEGRTFPTPVARLGALCEHANETCAERGIEGANATVPGVPAQEVPGLDAGAGVALDAAAGADGETVHTVEPYRVGTEQAYVGGCDEGCDVREPTAEVSLGHAWYYRFE